MKNPRNRHIYKLQLVLTIFILFCSQKVSIASATLDESEFIFMDQLHTGMTGEAHTVIDGSKIEQFQVELLGIARDAGFDNRDYLLCRVSGDVIDRSGGIAAGMSGSPVYFDGRLAGAISGHWSYTDQTVGIVTPIEHMLESIVLVKTDENIDSSNHSEMAWINRRSNEINLVNHNIRITSDLDPISDGDEMVFRSASTPFYISGIDENDIPLISPILAQLTNQELFRIPEIFPPNVKVPHIFVPGSTVSIPLCTGDINFGGIGTITWVSDDGKYFLGFGHSMGRRGPCRIPAGTGYIYGPLKSSFRSSKIGVALDPIGTVFQDRGGSIAGITGIIPEYIPVDVNVSGSGIDSVVTLKSNVTTSWDEYPLIATTAIIGSIARVLDGQISGTLITETSVIVKENNSTTQFHRSDYFSGNDIVSPYRDELQNLFMRIRDNDISFVEIQSISVDATFRNNRLEARIEGFSILTKDETKSIATTDNHNPPNEISFNTGSYSDPELDKDNSDQYILKQDSRYLARINLINFRSPKEIVYVPFTLPADYPSGKSRITVRGGSSDLPSNATVGKEVADYMRKWQKDRTVKIEESSDSLDNYLDQLFTSNRSNVLVFEIIHEKYDPVKHDESHIVVIETERNGTIKGIWERQFKIDDKK